MKSSGSVSLIYITVQFLKAIAFVESLLVSVVLKKNNKNDFAEYAAFDCSVILHVVFYKYFKYFWIFLSFEHHCSCPWHLYQTVWCRIVKTLAPVVSYVLTFELWRYINLYGRIMLNDSSVVFFSLTSRKQSSLYFPIILRGSNHLTNNISKKKI